MKNTKNWKGNKMTFLVSCANGAGTSLMMKLTLDAIKRNNIQATKVHHCALSEGKAQSKCMILHYVLSIYKWI